MQSASNTKINFLLGIRMCIMCPTLSMWKGVNQARDIILHLVGQSGDLIAPYHVAHLSFI